MKRPAFTAIIALGISASALGQQQAPQSYLNLPLSFEQNVGQTDSRAQFISRGQGYTLFLSSNQAIFEFHGVTFPSTTPSDEKRLGKRFLVERAKNAKRDTEIIRMNLLGANPGAQLTGLERMSSVTNYIIGRDPSKWRAGVPLFAKVQSSEVFPGTDLVYYGNGRQLEYDFVVKPGADPGAISLGFDGTTSTSIDASGNLSLATGTGSMKLNKPVIYQMIGGQRKEIDGKYVLRGANAAGVNVAGYDKTQPLIIDPVLVYSTYLGGPGNDGIDGITVDSSGNTYVVGWTDSANFPIVGTSLTPAPSGNQVAFVSKFNSAGTALIYSTFLGGSGGEWGNGIALDANGYVYVVGQTGSANFPVTNNAFQTALGTGASQNAFVSKLSADGQSLLYSTYLGGGNYDQGIGIAVDASQNVYVTGYTTSGSPDPFPTTANGFQTTLNSAYGNGFISRIDTTQSGSSSLVYSTFLGGSGNWDQTNGIAVDANHNVYVGGMTSSTDFPLTPTAYQTTVNPTAGTAFLTQIDTTKPGSTGLIYSTVIEAATYGASVALDLNGKAYVTGGAYVAKFDTTRSGSASLLYYTPVGGSSDSFTYGVVVDPNGDAYVGGWTWSTNLPVTPDAIQSMLGSGGQNSFVTALSPNGSTILFGTYLGGNGGADDFASGVAVDQNYNIYVAGATQSSNFPTTSGAFQTSLAGASNGFVTKFSPLNVPIITSISPATGVIGATITINGNNFGSSQGNSTVTFANGVTAPVTNWTATSIVVEIPSGATTGNVVVAVSGDQSNGVSFSVVPNITNLSPLSGFAGTQVTITGTGFGPTQGTSTVTFNGTTATATNWSDTSIIATVPSGPTTGNVVITVGGNASNGVSYTIVFPTITSLSPSSGPTGTSVTISGSNFGATQGSSTVTFSGTAATPTSWSPTSIVVPVPAAATTGNVVVTEGVSSSNGVSFSVVLNITSLFPLSGLAGTPITITGTGFGATQGTSNVTFNGLAATPTSWSDTSIVVPAPTGVTTGNVVVTVASLSSNGVKFTVLPTGWLDQDIGTVGLTGSATYSNGIFTVTGAGAGYDLPGGPADSFHFVYQSLSGDGTIVARVLTFQGNQEGYEGAGVMIRETLTPGSTNAATFKQGVTGSSFLFISRATTSGDPGGAGDYASLPYWVKVTRSGSTFTGYISPDDVNWLQVGSQTISMAQNVYIGLAVSSESTSALDTATFDNVSITSAASTAPVITSVSATTGSIGSQVVISGTGFGTSQGGSVVLLNDAPVTINSWTATSINITIPTGATSGYMVVSVAPSMNSGNPVVFEVTTQPLPATWLDQDIGSVGIAGNATYSSGTFTVNAAGIQIGGTADSIHFVYQPMSGDGTIVARLASMQLRDAAGGVMIRETLAPGATMAFMGETQGGPANFLYRTTTGGSSSTTNGNYVTLPYWFMLIRSGNTFKAYMGPDGVNWTQVGSTQTIAMAGNVFVGLAFTSANTAALATATFDNVAVSSTAAFINPVISSLNPPAGPVGGTITVTGTDFGTSQSSSQILFNGIAPSVSSWSSTSIAATVPSNATSGPVTVTVGGITSNAVQFSVIEAATVTGISPTSGPIGTSVVITGTGFGPTQSDSALTFYGANATSITNWSDTSISAVVPSGAATGNVTVTVAGFTPIGPVFTLTSQATLTDSLGNSSTYSGQTFGGQWLPTDSQGSGCSTCTVRGVIHNTYDSNGNVLSTTDPAGHTTTNTYDSSNNLLSQSVPLNGTTTATTSYTYNSFGEVLTVTDPLGNVTTNTYDSYGNLLTVTSPKPNSSTAASVTTFAYNSLGELTTITDPLGHVTTMTYTTAGLVATITDAQSNVTTYAYDAKGNRTSVTDALSHQTTFAYDSMSRLTTITYPDSTTSSFTYDIRGRRTSVTDQNGKTTSYAYDDADRLTSVTDAASHVTNYAYDTEDNLTSISDANSNQTAFTYDAFGRVTQTNFPSSLSENYQYDADNNLTQKTDRKSQTITYLYDALNRLTSKTYPDTTAVDYTYDLVGKIQQVNDPTGTYAFAYDNMGRLIGTTTSYSFLTSRNFTNAYTYDAASNRTGFTDPESGSTAYTYDTLNRLTSLVPPSAFGSGSFGLSYDALSRRTQMTRPNSVTTNYTYDNLSRLTSVLHQLSGSTIDGASYTLDSAGNRTAKTDQRAAVTSNYTYDAIYQLTQVTQSNNTTESYSYDPVGNRTASLGVSSYTTNASNEMTANSNASYTYDSNGNTLTKTVGSNTTSYAWDYENRLTSVTLPGTGGTVTFMYDPLGRRIYKSSSTGTSIFAYDNDNLIEETSSGGAVIARYSQTQNIDEPLAELRSSTTSYYEADGLTSVTSLTTSAGALANTYTYDSFGNLTASAGTLVNPLQYTAREFDSETNLYFYRARYYAPSIGRFISEDPMQFGAGENFFLYALNNVLNFNDPTGLCPPDCHCGCLKCHIINMLVTGYDNSFQSTGKNPGDPLYGITASGKKASTGTIAAPSNYAFGTGMYVPGYGCGTVQDRGGAIKGSHIDVWFPSTQQAKVWGVPHLNVEVCDDPISKK